MPLFRKKPVVAEAIQFDRGRFRARSIRIAEKTR